MGKAGPKPVDMGLLNMWEFEWYKALHVLRDGAALVGKWSARSFNAPPRHFTPKMIRSWIRRLEEMDAEEYERINDLTCDEISKEEGKEPRKNSAPGVSEVDSLVRREWALSQKEEETAALKRHLNPRQIPAERERRNIWLALCHARTLPILEQTCERWASLPDVRGRGLRPFPQHVLANAPEFFRMKRDVRFPKSNSPVFDESRLEYLARGMAGILEGISPMTAIEKLRNMKHGKGGPLWKQDPGGREYCNCWRCGLQRSKPLSRLYADAWWNGTALFMEIAEKDRARKEKQGEPL